MALWKEKTTVSGGKGSTSSRRGKRAAVKLGARKNRRAEDRRAAREVG